MSFRGGYGMFFGQKATQEYDHAVGPAIALRIALDAPPGGVEDPYSSLPGGFPYPYTPPQTAAERATFTFPQQFAFSTYDPLYRNAIVQSWNFNIQRQFFESYVLTLAYVGGKSNNLEVSAFNGGDIQANPAPIGGTGAVQARRLYHPFYSGINMATSWGNSLFHSFQINLNKRFSNGFTLLTSYTLASLMDDVTAGDNGLFDRSQERGPGGVRNRWVASFLWELPKLRNQAALVRHVFGGWESNGIVTLQSGNYLTVTTGTDVNNNGNNADRPNLVGNPYLDTGRPRGELIARYFNPAAFVPNTPTSIGNAGRGLLVGPGLATVDYGLFKNFQIKEKYQIQYRAEFFNLLNRPTLGNPITSIANTANVGRITGTAAGSDPRVIQMALKFRF
jgi:hypothetical protein